jgi:hypothetical protein
VSEPKILHEWSDNGTAMRLIDLGLGAYSVEAQAPAPDWIYVSPAHALAEFARLATALKRVEGYMEGWNACAAKMRKVREVEEEDR